MTSIAHGITHFQPSYDDIILRSGLEEMKLS